MAENAGQIDKLTIEIGASSAQAVENIKKLQSALESLKAAVRQIDGDAGNKLKNLAVGLKAMSEAGKISISDKLGHNISELSGALRNIDSTKLSMLSQLGMRLKGLEGLSKCNISDKYAERIVLLSAAVNEIAPDAPQKLEEFGKALQTMNGISASIGKDLPERMQKLADAMNHISVGAIAKLRQMCEALSMLQGVNLTGFSTAVNKASSNASKIASKAKESEKESRSSVKTSGVRQQVDEAWAALTGSHVKKQIQWTFSLLENIKLIGKEWLDVAGKVEKVSKAISSINPNIKLAVSVAGGLVTALNKILTTVFNIAKGIAKWAFNTAINAVKKIWSVMKNIANVVIDIAKKLPGAFAKITNLSAITNMFKSLKTVLSSLGRIAFYRAVRSAIKAVTESFKEGSERAYFYAKQYGVATKYISDALDRLSSGSFKMQNQLGASWSTLLATIEPILIKIINIVTRAAEVVTEFFAVLGGSGTYLKAKDYTKAWADETEKGAKAAKEWKNQLMDFDTLNVLKEPNDNAGSGNNDLYKDYENMFEEAKVESRFADFFNKVRDMIKSGRWGELGTLLAEKLNTITNAFDWRGWGTKIGKALQNGIDFAYNFLSGYDFKNLGSKLAQLIDSTGDQINFKTLGRLATRISTAIWDILYGAFTNPGSMKNLAINLSNFVLGALTELAEWLEGLNPVMIANAIRDFFSNIKYIEIRDAFVRVIKAAWSLAVGLKEEIWNEETKAKVTAAITEFFDGLTWSDVKDIIVQKLTDAWSWIKNKINVIWPKSERDAFMQNLISAFDKAFTEWLPALHNILMYELDKAVFGENWAAYVWGEGNYAGKEVIMGLIHGTNEKKGDLEKQMEDISDVVTDTTERMLDIGSPSKVFERFGEWTMIGFLDGLKEKFKDISTFFQNLATSLVQVGKSLVSGLSTGFSEMWGTFSNTASSLVTSLTTIISTTVQNAFNSLATSVSGMISSAKTSLTNFAQSARDSISNIITNSKNTLSDIVGSVSSALNRLISQANSRLSSLRSRSYATGGFPEDGVFYANRGELVGKFDNGRTAVANNEQIIAGIERGVYRAMSSVMGGSSGDNGNEINVYIGDELVYSGFNKWNKRQTLITGGRA